VAAAEPFVRIIVRRPHAYFFLDDLYADRGGIRSATPEGATVGDGATAPLPGIYVLDAEGRLLGSVALAGAGARDALVAALRVLSGE